MTRSGRWRSSCSRTSKRKSYAARFCATEPRIDGRDTKTVRPIRLPGRHPAAGARLGAVHARRDAGAGRRHARHRPGRADHRRAGRRIPRELHAALQFPALLDRRSRPHGVARAARDRPRQARLARGATVAAAEGELPLHGPRRLRDHRIERLVVDGFGMRRLAGADGCRRAAAAPGRRYRDGADQGAGRVRRARPTSSATRTISATWTSRWPAPSAASRRCRWTSRSPRSPRRSCASRSIRRRTDARHILGEMAKALTGRARRGQRERAADHDLLDPARQDPRGHRFRRQGHSRDHRDDRRQDRHRRRRHDQGRRGRRQGGAGGDRLDPRHRRRTRTRGDLYRARSSKSSISAPS